MSRKHEYRQYLRSPRWRQLREEAMHRANRRCEMCGEPGRHVHHVKYPKQLKDDALHNLVVLCASCHARSHGMRYEVTEPKLVQIPGKDVINQIDAVEHEGDTWLSIEKLKTALLRDGWQTGNYAPEAGWYQLESEMEEDEYIMREIQTANGTRIEKFVNEMGAGRLSMAFPHTTFAKNVRKYYKQLHRDDRARRKSDVATTSTNTPADIADALGKHLAPILSSFGSQIKHIESSVPILRDEEEFVTVRSRIREHAYDESQQVYPSGHNLEEWVGIYLKHNGYVAGDRKEMIRLGGTSRQVPANTWKRKDIDHAIHQAFSYTRRTKQIN